MGTPGPGGKGCSGAARGKPKGLQPWRWQVHHSATHRPPTDPLRVHTSLPAPSRCHWELGQLGWNPPVPRHECACVCACVCVCAHACAGTEAARGCAWALGFVWVCVPGSECARGDLFLCEGVPAPGPSGTLLPGVVSPPNRPPTDPGPEKGSWPLVLSDASGDTGGLPGRAPGGGHIQLRRGGRGTLASSLYRTAAPRPTNPPAARESAPSPAQRLSPPPPGAESGSSACVASGGSCQAVRCLCGAEAAQMPCLLWENPARLKPPLCCHRPGVLRTPPRSPAAVHSPRRWRDKKGRPKNREGQRRRTRLQCRGRGQPGERGRRASASPALGHGARPDT